MSSRVVLLFVIFQLLIVACTASAQLRPRQQKAADRAEVAGILINGAEGVIRPAMFFVINEYSADEVVRQNGCFMEQFSVASDVSIP